jgi:hypothetical protein
MAGGEASEDEVDVEGVTDELPPIAAAAFNSSVFGVCVIVGGALPRLFVGMAARSAVLGV